MSLSSCFLLTLGTPGGRWHELAVRLLECAPLTPPVAASAFTAWHDEISRESDSGANVSHALQVTDAQVERFNTASPSDEAWGGVHEMACWTIESLSPRLPAAKYLIFVESPVSALNTWLATEPDANPETFLRDWRIGADCVHRHILLNRSRCTVVLTDEFMANASAVAELCQQRLGVVFDTSALSLRSAQVDPLQWGLAASFVLAERKADGLFEELRATCDPLNAFSDSVLAPRVALLNGASSAIQRLAELNSSERERLEVTKLLERESQALARAMASEESLRQLGTEQHLRLADHAAELSQLRHRRDQTERATREARTENELLLLQLYQANEKLERAGSGDRSRGDKATQALAGTETRLQVGEWAIGQVRDEAPHRELNLSLRQARFGSRQSQELAVRLVDHHGNAGLAIFSSGSEPNPFEQWYESGREGDRSFQLWIPSDSNTIAQMELMRTSDWLLLSQLAWAIERHLSERAVGLPARWPMVARRFAHELEDLPPRLRYNKLTIARVPNERAFDATLFGVSFAARCLDSLRFRWGFGSSAGRLSEISLELFAPSGGVARLPLTAWQIAPDGSAPASMILRFGNASNQVHDRNLWASLTALDRSFVLGLLSSVAHATAKLEPGTLPDGIDSLELVANTTRLINDARRALQGSTLKAFVRSLLGRKPMMG